MNAPTTYARLHSSFLMVISVFFLSLPLQLSGCSSPPKRVVQPGPPIPGLNLTGSYDCIHFGFMKLRQTGDVVRGTYEGLRNNGDNGTLTGKIEGDVLWVDWVQPGNLENAVLPKKGRGYLRISQRGTHLEGKWGYDQSQNNGGDWVADKSEFSE